MRTLRPSISVPQTPCSVQQPRSASNGIVGLFVQYAFGRDAPLSLLRCGPAHTSMYGRSPACGSPMHTCPWSTFDQLLLDATGRYLAGAAAAQVFEGVVKSRCFEREPVAVEGFFNTISPLCDDPFMYPIRE